MPSIKEVKNRIGSVKSTQQLTKAMKMVAAAKLKKAQKRGIPFCYAFLGQSISNKCTKKIGAIRLF